MLGFEYQPVPGLRTPPPAGVKVVVVNVPVRGGMRDPVVPADCPQDVADLITACTQRNQVARPSAKEVCRCAPQHFPHTGPSLASGALLSLRNLLVHPACCMR